MFLERLDRLRDRAAMLAKARHFFAERKILEVDPSSLVPRAPLDANIDVISAAVSDTEVGFLHTSPEYAMKRLLAEGAPDIFYLGHVFRKGEIGKLHNPEFTMAEWYRLSFSLRQMIEETVEFLSLFFGTKPSRFLSYRDAFQEYVGIDYTRDNLVPLLPSHALGWSRETALQYLLAEHIEPRLGQGEITALTDYPPHEAALACVVEKGGEPVAERFELYFEGVELANGYRELSNARILRQRFEEENRARLARGQESYLLDEAFLEAMEKGLPDCCGVAVGFDRALMLRSQTHSLAEVLPFGWISNQKISLSINAIPQTRFATDA